MSRHCFNNTRFLVSAATLAQCPPDVGTEIAFAGRSNVGKSSVINAVTANSKLARTSKEPGRTRLLNFFQVAENQRLVDLPGYGFARVPEKIRLQWGKEIQAYFSRRQSLRGLILIMDIRHPFRDTDTQMLEWCANAGLRVHVLLNKADKVSHSVANTTMRSARKLPGMEDVSVQLFSVLKKTGIDELRQTMMGWLG